MQRWRDISTDPNDPTVYKMRRDAISKTRVGELIVDRANYISELVAGKSVLDIGVVEHTRKATDSPQWLHGYVSRCAKSCLGVDVIEAEVKHLKMRGYNVILADITLAPLDQKFDVIIGGEVLEHLDAPGMFMKNCATMLDPGGQLVITVPNPWYINPILKSCFSRHTFVDNADHVAWYDASTLFELGQRHGFKLERVTGIATGNPKSLCAKLFFGARPMLGGIGLTPQLFAKSVMYEFVRV